jgi:O-antigen/teichoic acid export membrane protein
MSVVLQTFRRSHLARNAAWVFAGQGLSFVSQGFYFVCLARLLGESQYGILAAAVALVSMVSQYSTMGSGLLLLRHVSPDHGKFREYWGNVLLCTAFFGLALVLGLHWAGRWLIGPASASLLIFLALGDCLCSQLTACASQVFQTFQQLRTTAGLNLMTNVLRLAIAAVMLAVLRHASARQWAIASLFVSLLAVTAGFSAVTSKFGWPRFSLRLFGQRLSEGFIFAVSGSTTAAYNDIDKVMLGHYGMTLANSVYTMAYRMVNIATMPIMSIQAAAFPRFFLEGARGMRGTIPLARKLLRRTVVLGLASAAGMFLLSPLIPFVVGKAFAASAEALRWLCLIPVFRSLHVCAGDAMAGAGHQRFRLLSQSLAAGGNFAINLYLIPHYSWRGAAWASLLTDGSLAAMSWTVLFWLRRHEVEPARVIEAV